MKMSLPVSGLIGSFALVLMGSGCVPIDQTARSIPVETEGVTTTLKQEVTREEGSSSDLFTCKQKTDCVLTTELYHPCGLVSSIRVDASKASINAYNMQQREKFKGKRYDCPPPPMVEESFSYCQNNRCALGDNGRH